MHAYGTCLTPTFFRKKGDGKSPVHRSDRSLRSTKSDSDALFKKSFLPKYFFSTAAIVFTCAFFRIKRELALFQVYEVPSQQSLGFEMK